MSSNSLRGQVLCAVALAALATQVRATTITFEDLPVGTVVTNQFQGVVFSTVPGQELRVVAQPFDLLDNFLCTADIGGPVNCEHDVRLAFSTPVNGLSFYAVGDDGTGPVAAVDVFTGGQLAGTVDILGDGEPLEPSLVDLSAFENVTSILIHSVTDSMGLGYDEFTFRPVPEPSGLALGATACGALVLRRRRFRTPLR